MSIVDVYSIQIVLDDCPYQDLDLDAVAELMDETEENITDLLPACYRARIRRWNHPDEGDTDE